MKLQTKFTLTILAGILFVYLASQFTQQVSSGYTIKRLAEANLKTVEGDQWRMLTNLKVACEGALIDTMTAGEMDRFSKLLENQKKVEGLQELGLANYKGMITYSTIKANLHTPLAPELASRVLSDAALFQRKTDTTLDLFQPLAVTKECRECHNEFKDAKVGGVLYFRFSTQFLESQKAQWDGFAQAVDSANLRSAGYTTALLVISMIVLVAVLVRTQVTKPLEEINRSLLLKSGDVRTAATAIANANTELANGASKQAAATEEASASLEEMSSMTKRNLEDSQTAQRMADDVRIAAQEGVRTMDQMASTMKDIEKASGNVSGILKTIDDIAFQTNILALNAAVEAARAGDAGSGFAVVADEVRSLAHRSAEAARSTTGMSADALEKSRRGSNLTLEVSRHLNSILEKAAKEDTLVSQIALANAEQSQGIVQVTAAIRQVDQVTQANVAGGEENASAAEQLDSLAKDLQDDAKALDKLIHGTRDTS